MATIKELIVKITTNAKKAKDDVKDFGKATEDVGKKSKTTAEGVGKLSKTETDLSTSATKAKDETHKLKGKVEGLIAPVKDAGDALNVMKGALGAFGVTVGIQQLVNAFKEMADNAKAARDEYNQAKAELIDYNGALSKSQQEMVDAIYTRSAGNIGFTDKSQVNKAVAYSSTFWGDGTPEQVKDIAKQLTSMQAVNAISDTASFATKAKESFTDWGISTGDVASSMDYLYQVAVQTKIPLENLMDFMTSNVDVLKELGYTFEESASMIGDSFAKTGSTKGMQDALDEYQNKVESNMEIMTEREAKYLAKLHVSEYTKTLNDSLPEAQSAYEAWKQKVQGSSELMGTIRDKSTAVEGVKNPKTPFEKAASFQDNMDIVVNTAETLGTQLSQIEAINWVSLIDEGNSLEDVLKMMEDTGGNFELLNRDGIIPMNDSLGASLTATQNLANYVINTLIPDLGAEIQTVKNLTDYYWDLYKAKKAVAEV